MKCNVIDTNVFLDDPHILSRISKYDTVVLPWKVIDELDKHKTNGDRNLAENARIAINILNKSINKGNRNIKTEKYSKNLLPEDYDFRSPDNKILSIAINHKEHNVCLVTSDSGLQLKAKTNEIPNYSLNEFYEFLDEREQKRKKSSK